MVGAQFNSWADVVDSAYYTGAGSGEALWLWISILLCILALWWGHGHEARANIKAGPASNGTSAAAGGAASFASSSAKSNANFVDAIVLIDGIGKKTEKGLAAAGVTKLTQIVAMSDAQLSKLCADVGAKDNWKTQEWKEQAEEMMAGKPPRAKVDRELAKKMMKKAKK